MKSQHGKPQEGSWQPIEGSEALYSLVPRNRTPRVNPGETVEIEVFLSGHGVPEKNKLHVQWSSPYMINVQEPGTATYCIKVETNPVTGESQPRAGKMYLQTVKLDPTGRTIHLNNGYFLEVPPTVDKEVSEFVLPRVMSELAWDEEPPILIKLNMAENARSGDYEVAFTFTYGSEHELLQDYKAVRFHITSRWERHQGWLTAAGVLLTLLALVATAVGTVWQIFGQ